MRLKKDNSTLFPLKKLKALYSTMGIMLSETSTGRLTCLCPFDDHTDHSPSFVVYPDGGYHCYGCGRHGALEDVLLSFGVDPEYNLSKIDLTISGDAVKGYLSKLRNDMEIRLQACLKTVDIKTACTIYDKFDRFLVKTRFVEFSNRLEAAVVFKRATVKLGGNYDGRNS